MNSPTKTYVFGVIAAGGATLIAAAMNWTYSDAEKLGLLAILAVLASMLKIQLPGINSTLSPGFIIVLVSAALLTWTETAIICPLAAVTQHLWHAKSKPNILKVLFNASALTVSGVLAAIAARDAGPAGGPALINMCAALVVLYFANTSAVSVVVCLAQSAPLRSTFKLCNYQALPAYLAGTVLAWAMIEAGQKNMTAILIPAALIVPSYLFYQSWIERSVRPEHGMHS